jgi:hypothetical protein
MRKSLRGIRIREGRERNEGGEEKMRKGKKQRGLEGEE